jgi:hypothetical protein
VRNPDCKQDNPQYYTLIHAPPPPAATWKVLDRPSEAPSTGSPVALQHAMATRRTRPTLARPVAAWLERIISLGASASDSHCRAAGAVESCGRTTKKSRPPPMLRPRSSAWDR